MAKPEWGEKHRCTSCGKPFYDMQRDPIVCPACGTEHVPEKLLKPRKTVSAPSPAKKPAPAAADTDQEEGEDILLNDDAILEAEEGADLPDDEDDDDLSGVVSAPVKDEEL